MKDIILESISYFPMKKMMEDVLKGESKIGIKEQIYKLEIGQTIHINLPKKGDF